MRYDVQNLIDEIKQVVEAHSTKSKELEKESENTNKQIQETALAITQALINETLGKASTKTPISALEKKQEGLQKRMGQLSQVLPFLKEVKQNAIVEKVRELGQAYKEELVPKMKADAAAQEEAIKLSKATYYREIQRLYELQQEQEALNSLVRYQYHLAGISGEETPFTKTYGELQFPGSYLANGEIAAGASEQEIRKLFTSGKMDEKLAALLK